MYLIPIYSLIIFSIYITLVGNRLSYKVISYILNIILTINIIIINFILYEIYLNDSNISITLYTWFSTELLYIDISFLFDKVSVLLFYLIIIIYTVVVKYSFWYMEEESHLIKFINYLNIFSIMMIILVLSKNLVMMLIGWEGVGISSFLLINFWNNRILANKSSIKALLYNKVGDVFFIFSIVIINAYYLNINSFFTNYIFNLSIHISDIIIGGFIIAAIAKSAQIGFHCWLGDAMEGPTPVSALLHAATMVTAGIFLILRILPLTIFNYNNILTIIGVLTLLLGGFISLFQNDIKKIIAFSTCSQLGYMLYSASLGLYNISYYHLIIHGFFKALLFLSAGIIIHKFYNIQDLRKYGSFIFNLPLSYLFFIIGTLAITSIPFFSGYYSKDFLILNSYYSNLFIYILSLLGVLLTTTYSIRLIFLIFFNKPKKILVKFNLQNKIHFSSEPFFYLFLFLFLGSIFLGFFIQSLFNSPLNSSNSFPFLYLDTSYINHLYHILPLLILILGLILAILFDYIFLLLNFKFFISYYIFFFTLLNKKFFFDYIINYFSVIFNSKISYQIFYKNIDKGIFEWFSIGLGRLFFNFKYYIFPSYTLSPLENNSQYNNYILNANNTLKEKDIFVPYTLYIFFILIINIIIYIMYIT